MNAHEGKAGVVLFAGKLCDPRLSALSVVATIKALYTGKFTSFLFLSFFFLHECDHGGLREDKPVGDFPWLKPVL